MMKKFYLTLMVALLLFSCDNEVLNDVQKSSPSFESIAPSMPFLWDEIYEIKDGKEIDLTAMQLSTRASTHEFYEMATINPAFIYCGSLMTAESINKGVYVPVAFYNDVKETVSISFSLPVKSKVIPTKRTAFEDAIKEAVGDKDFSGRQSQSFTYKMKQFTKYSEVKLAFGANVNIGQLFGVNVSVNNDKISTNSALLVDFSQVYFNVIMDIPDDGNVFRTETARQKYLGLNPVYVNLVNYGRKGLILVESEESYSSLSVAVRVAFNAGIVGGQISLDANTKNILQKATISICILGGDGVEAVKTVKGFDAFQDFIINGGVYCKEVFGTPVSFGGAYASDNGMFVSSIRISD